MLDDTWEASVSRTAYVGRSYVSMPKVDEALDSSAAAPISPTSAPRDPISIANEFMLLEFLRNNDAECPVCGYNVRALTRPVCPECKQELVLTVGASRLSMGWLFAALAPGFFSGIAAFFVLIPIGGQLFFGNGRPEWVIIALDLFGWSSLVFAIILASRWRVRFLSLPRPRQRNYALFIWAAHVMALFLLVAYAVAHV